MRELLGELLLALNRPAQALQAFELSLKTAPNRFRGFHGAAKAADRLAIELRRNDTTRSSSRSAVTLTAIDPSSPKRKHFSPADDSFDRSVLRALRRASASRRIAPRHTLEANELPAACLAHKIRVRGGRPAVRATLCGDVRRGCRPPAADGRSARRRSRSARRARLADRRRRAGGVVEPDHCTTYPAGAGATPASTATFLNVKMAGAASCTSTIGFTAGKYRRTIALRRSIRNFASMSSDGGSLNWPTRVTAVSIWSVKYLSRRAAQNLSSIRADRKAELA